MASRSLDDLHPILAEKAKKLIDLCSRAGIDLRITSTYRSFAEQATLYAKGRTTKGPKVTNAKPGQSWHSWRLAFDCAPFVNGKPAWESKHWDKIGTLGKEIGLRWGGDWLVPDRPHFQMTLGLTLAEANRRHLAGLDIFTGDLPASKLA